MDRSAIRQWFERLDYLDVVLWLFRVVLLVGIVWGTAATLLGGKYSAEIWLDFLVFGLAQGSLYALIALGYTLVYGVLLMINFAHGEFFMSGIFTATVFIAIPMGESGFTDRHPIVALLIISAVAMAVSVGIAVLTERVAYRPLRRAPRLVPLITAIGASFFWQYFFRGLYGSGITAFPDVALVKGLWSIGGIEIQKAQVVVIIASVFLLIGLYFFVMRTKIGKAIRAVSENKDIAALMGIDVDRAITLTFVVGAAMAGAVVAGRHKDFAAAQKAMSGLKRKVYRPDPAAHRVYRELYALYKRLHDAFGTAEWTGGLHDVMKKLLDIRAKARR